MNEMLANFWIDVTVLVKILVAVVWILAVIFVAKIISGIVGSLIKKATLIKTTFGKIGVDVNLDLVASVVSKVLYFVLIIGAIIGGLAYVGILGESSLGGFISDYIMPLLNASILWVIAWFLAVLAKTGITKLLQSTDIDEKIGSSNDSSVSISQSLSTVGYWAVILYFLPQILAKLGQDELLAPITNIINNITAYIPQLIGAGITIAIAYFIGKFISKLVTELLWGLGFDKVLGLIGIKNNKSTMTPSGIIGKLVFVYIVLFASLEAVSQLGFNNLTEIINQFIAFGSNILTWVVIFGIGMYLANLASGAIKSATSSKFLPKIASWAIIVLTSFMGLQQMGLGWDIINQAFTLLLGAVAVAFALSVGLGSKEVAWEEVKKFIENMKK